MNDGTSLDIGHYFSDVFDVNTVIWCHCDDDGTTQISGFLEGVYTSESHQKKNCYVRLRQSTINDLYKNNIPYSIHICI